MHVAKAILGMMEKSHITVLICIKPIIVLFSYAKMCMRIKINPDFNFKWQYNILIV